MVLCVPREDDDTSPKLSMKRGCTKVACNCSVLGATNCARSTMRSCLKSRVTEAPPYFSKFVRARSCLHRKTQGKSCFLLLNQGRLLSKSHLEWYAGAVLESQGCVYKYPKNPPGLTKGMGKTNQGRHISATADEICRRWSSS